MDRVRRRRLAEQLAAKIARSRKDLVAVVLFGSVARADDALDSDVEMFALVRRASLEPQQFVLDGTLFTVYWSSASGFRAHMLEPDGDATRFGFVEGVALYDPRGWFARLRRDIASLPPSFFQKSAKRALASTYESLGKARNAERRSDRTDLDSSVRWVAHEALVVLALINRRHYTTERSMVSEWKEFPDVPRGFERRLLPCLHPKGSNRQRRDAAEALWRLLRNWSSRRNVRIPTVRSIASVTIPKSR